MDNNVGKKRRKRFLEVLLLLMLASVLVAVRNHNSPPPPPPVKPLSAQQRADAEEFFEDVRLLGSVVVEEAPKEFVKTIKNDHPYEVYRDLSEIKSLMSRFGELALESDRLEQELELLGDSGADEQRQAEIEKRLDEIDEELFELEEKLEAL